MRTREEIRKAMVNNIEMEIEAVLREIPNTPPAGVSPEEHERYRVMAEEARAFKRYIHAYPEARQ